MVNGKVPKILIGCPTYQGKEYCLKEYLAGVKNLTYPNYDLVLVDNSEDDTYFKTLQSLGVRVLKEPGIGTPIERVVNSRNKLLDLMLKGDYEYFFSLEQDVIAPPDAIERLLLNKKRICGGVYFTTYHFASKLKIRPLMWGEVGDTQKMRFMLKESKGDNVHKVRATGLGCLLIHRSVLEKIRFASDQKKTIYDDVVFCRDAKKKGFDVFVDAGVKCKHIIDLDGNYVTLYMQQGKMQTELLRKA